MMVLSLSRSFAGSPLKRAIKQPKIYAGDNLLIHQPLGTGFSLQSSIDRSQIGALYESFIFNEIKKTITNYGIVADCFAWRTEDKSEVDIILSSVDNIVPIEVKWSKKPSKRDASGLHSYMSSHKAVKKGFIVYPGEDIVQITDTIFAIPDWWLFGCY